MAKQNIIFFINAISSLVALTYTHHYYYYHYCFYYYYHYYYCFILRFSFFFFFFFFFFVNFTMVFVCFSGLACMCFPVFFSFLLLIIYILFRIDHTCQASFFFHHYHLCYHCHQPFHFIFIKTTSHWGRIQRINSSDKVYLYPLITLGKS